MRLFPIRAKNVLEHCIVMNENKSKYEFDAKQIIDMLLKRWWIIVIAVVLFVGLAVGYTKLAVTPTYTSYATLLINGGSGMTSYQQILAGQYQSKDYPYILKSHDTLGAVAERLNADGEKKYTSSSLSGMVSYSAEDDSRIFRISVTSADPKEACEVAGVMAEVFSERTEKLTKAEVQSVENPRLPTSASSSGMKKNVVLGAAIGLILGAAIAIFMGLGSDVLDSEEWLLKNFKDEVPLLATIPDSSASGGRNYYRYKYKRYYGYSSNNKSDTNTSK